MNTFKKTALLLVTATSLLTFNVSANAKSTEYIENALVDVCKSVQKGKMGHYRATTKAYNLRDKTIALKVVCNGSDIIDFAEQNNAFKIANKLQKSIGDVSINDTITVAKVNVTF